MDLLYAKRICSRLCSKSIGPADIFLRLGTGSLALERADLVVPGSLDLLDVLFSGWRGLELRSVGESFGGVIDLDRNLLLLPFAELLRLGGGGLRSLTTGVGVLFNEVGVLDREGGGVILEG